VGVAVYWCMCAWMCTWRVCACACVCACVWMSTSLAWPYLAQHKGIHTSKTWGLDQTRCRCNGECTLTPFIYDSFHVSASRSPIHDNTWILIWINELKSNEIVVQINHRLESLCKATLDPVPFGHEHHLNARTELDKVCKNSADLQSWETFSTVSYPTPTVLLSIQKSPGAEPKKMSGVEKF